MKLAISREQQRQLLDWAAAAHPLECCGLLFGRNGIIRQMQLVANVAADPAQHFELDPQALIAAEKAARAGVRAGAGVRAETLPILGYFHSHPSGDCSPSVTDAAQAAPDGRLWVIVAGGEIKAWRAVADGAVHGRFDAVLLKKSVSIMSQILTL
jgi:desampylase